MLTDKIANLIRLDNDVINHFKEQHEEIYFIMGNRKEAMK